MNVLDEGTRFLGLGQRDESSCDMRIVEGNMNNSRPHSLWLQREVWCDNEDDSFRQSHSEAKPHPNEFSNCSSKHRRFSIPVALGQRDCRPWRKADSFLDDGILGLQWIWR